MRFSYVLLTLLLLSACTKTTPGEFQPQDHANQTAPNGPSQQETPSETRAPIISTNTSERINESFENLSSNDSGYDEWRTQAKNAVVLLVSDGEKAARALLEVGQETTLPLQPEVTIRIGAVDEQQAQLLIDNQSVIVEEDSEAYNADKSVIIYLTEIIVQG